MAADIDDSELDSDLKETPLTGLHRALGAKMVPFAGYDMPVQYALGVMKEHLHTRAAAGLFDVSHMGQVILRAPDGDAARLDAALEKIIPVDVAGLAEGRQRYGFLTNENGGIEDDLMIARREDHLFVVVNAARKDNDLRLLRAALEPEGIRVKLLESRALIALQGPQAEDVLAEHYPDIRNMRFMDVETLPLGGAECWVSRSGYTGEDGFELLLPNNEVGLGIVKALLEDDRVKPIGLGARDSLRLEAGLCLYGHDLSPDISPIEADLGWVIQKRRREAADFPGAARILKEQTDGPSRRRVGIQPLERAPAREGTEIQIDGKQVGIVTSGGFGPSVEKPVAMGYVSAEHAAPGTKIDLIVRGKARAAEVCELPFVQPNYKR